MNRRDFVKTVGFGFASICVGVGLKEAAGADTKKPNIIYIMADDLGYGELGCYGQKLIKTPNIDAMATQGMKFTQHYSGSALCAPSRCCLMTGKHTGHAYIRNNKPLPFEGNLPIPKEEVTVAEVMKSAGYTTGCIGKWGIGYPGSEGDPNKQGFDHWFGYNCQRQAHSYYPTHLWRNADKVMLKGNENGKKGQYSHDLLTVEALEFIRKNKAKPFFLYIPYTIPHTKFQVPELGEYEDKDWDSNHKIQAAMISRMDADVGKILSLLKKLNVDDNTLVIFTSDNGPHGGGGTLQKFAGAGQLRAKKGTLYEGGVRVPMIARWPGRIKPATVTDHVSAFWDVLPTCAELAGAAIPAGIDGLSFAATLLGKSGNQKEHDYLYWELGVQQAMRQGNWKLVRKWNKRAASPGKAELYDLADDIAESKNIADKHPEIVSKMLTAIKSARTTAKEFKSPYDA
ncbi:MAG: arylsulfatase [Anaerohalosphaera sp.]|nr:arylsulfatase [Anaerohalosphaera sp.]